MVFFHFDMHRETYIVPFVMDEELKKMGVISTSYHHLYYLSPESNYTVENVLEKINENTLFTKRLYNVNVLNIDCPETINYIMNLTGKKMLGDKNIIKHIKKKKILFELQEVCFGEDDVVLIQEIVDRIIRELLAGEFYNTDKKNCEDNEIRLYLHHLEGANDEDLGYCWLKFKVYRGAWKKVLFELQEVYYEEDTMFNQKEVDAFIQEKLFGGAFYCTDKERCKDNEIRFYIHYLDDENGKDLGYYWMKFKITDDK